MSGRRSRSKGARGELEVGKLIAAAGFHGARMGRNGYSAEDVEHSIPNVHIEVKRTEKMLFSTWIKQAERDCGDKTPVIVHRGNGEPWRALVPFDYLLDLMARVEGVAEGNNDSTQ
jgi:hypothetical protein